MDRSFVAPPGSTQSLELAENANSFFEADRLDRLAYEIIGQNSADPDSWHRFTIMKARAEAKRIDAHQVLMRIKLEMKS